MAVLAGFVQRPRVRGPVVHDARVAAICVAHGVETLLTRDRDFSLFPELTVEDPLPDRLPYPAPSALLGPSRWSSAALA